MNLTEEQLRAISLREQSVSVSAAAGAGKTRVLVERICAYIKDDGRNIDDFLIITYTRAAAAELRDRIFKRLRELSNAHSQNSHLTSQLTRVYTAKIGTFDAYCRELILQNAALCGLPNGYRNSDDAELSLMQERVLEEVLERLYEEAARNPECSFNICAETYMNERGDRDLRDILLEIYKKTRPHSAPAKWLAERANEFAVGESPPWVDVLYNEALTLATAYREGFFCHAERYEEARLRDLEKFNALISKLEERDWDDLTAYLETFGLDRINNLPKGEKATGIEANYRTHRDNFKKVVGEKIHGLIYGRMSEHIEDAKSLKPLVSGLADAVIRFAQALDLEKSHLSVLDFTDVQRLVLKILESSPTHDYCEILVDEFQDINPLQNEILQKLSNGGQNIFYVGDVRQSIYRFQLAEPKIFLEILKSQEASRINLTKNFRSKRGILEAVNNIFSKIDCPEMGTLSPDEFMLSGNSDETPESDAVEFLLTGDREGESEALAVARRVKRLIDGGAKPEDCVILMRSPKKKVPEYSKALEELGINCETLKGEDYFSRPEIKTILALLEVIENSSQDVALISALRSPAAGLTADELAELRTLSEGLLYKCLPLSKSNKVLEFLERLNKWRLLAPELPLHLLAAHIIADCKLAQSFSPVGNTNILQFPDFIKKYKGGLKGLSDWVLRQKESPNAGRAAKSAVMIMSIHASKGLEFPNVIIADLSKQFNLQDANKRFLAHQRLGLGVKIFKGLKEYPTPGYSAIRATLNMETRAEELRLLYVAMTRAQDKLILSLGTPKTPNVLNEIATAGDIALSRNMASILSKIIGLENYTSESEIPLGETDETAEPDAPAKFLKDGWAYPHEASIDLPSKMTVTGLLNQDVKDFYTTSKPRSPQAALMRGNATHLFMQYADLANCRTHDGARREITRLINSSKLTKDEAVAVDLEAIEGFMSTERGLAIINAEEVRREFKFSIFIKDGDLDGVNIPADDEVLLQGVIDCYYKTPDGLVLLDFKTDNISPKEAAARAEKYRAQIEAYAFALAQIEETPVCEKVLVFLSAGTEVKIKTNETQ